MSDDIETLRGFLTARVNLKSMHVEATEALAALERLCERNAELDVAMYEVRRLANSLSRQAHLAEESAIILAENLDLRSRIKNLETKACLSKKEPLK